VFDSRQRRKNSVRQALRDPETGGRVGTTCRKSTYSTPIQLRRNLLRVCSKSTIQ
jgi:hypothetical protein